MFITTSPTQKKYYSLLSTDFDYIFSIFGVYDIAESAAIVKRVKGV